MSVLVCWLWLSVVAYNPTHVLLCCSVCSPTKLILSCIFILASALGPVVQHTSLQRVKCSTRRRARSKDAAKWTPMTSVKCLNPFECKGNYSATANNVKLVHWPLMGGLLHLVQRGGDWAGPQPAQAPPRCTKCNSPPINSQCTNHRIAV